jgi:hypothetical protein
VQEKPHLPSLNETFKKDDKNPFGGYIAYNQVKRLFGYRYVQINEAPFDEAWQDIYADSGRYSLYMLLTKNLIFSNNEADALIGFVKEGNDLFIAADYIDDDLLNKIRCQEERRSEIVAEVAGLMKHTSIAMHKDYRDANTSYKYYYYPFLNSFCNYNSTYAKVLGINEKDSPNYMVFFIGRGRLYLHAAPRAFSNYFLLTQSNYEYLQNILSYLRPNPQNIYWDEYYKTKRINRRKGGNNQGRDNAFSSLNVIRKHPPLLWAFWLSIAALIIYVLFNLKRKQRIINEVKPNANTTLVFAETVGRLYLQKKDNKNISEKMITYFYEYIRNKFFMNTGRINEQFVVSLASKAGVNIDEAEKLFITINKLQSSEVVSDVELLSLNNQLQNFYKSRS